MFDSSHESLMLFIACVFILLLIFSSFIITIIFKYQKRQLAYTKHIEEIKVSHENTLLQSQIEIQEQTFQHVAREIHDNIGQKLTLAKLYLNTTILDDQILPNRKIQDMLSLISDAISDLSNLSKSMAANSILENGLVKAIQNETDKLTSSGKYKADFLITGTEYFLDTKRELILFRILQEALNNIVKHAAADMIQIIINYEEQCLTLFVKDNGKGFHLSNQNSGSGIMNIHNRAEMLSGSCEISSNMSGTGLTIKIPKNADPKNL